MRTLRLVVDPDNPETAEAREAIDRAAGILRAGGTVALPTETVYGLGANALDAEAVGRIFAAKQRPSWDPVIVHVAGPEQARAMVEELVENAPATAGRLRAAFWPGPLTLLLPRTAAVPDVVTAGRPLVGVRMPAHPVALAVIKRAGVPIAAPSANVFGHTSPTTAAHVLDDLDGRIDAVLDAGPCRYGVESTVLDPGRSPMTIYRPGAVTIDQIRAMAGDVEFFKEAAWPGGGLREALPSPGVGLRHYAPRARLVLLEAPLSAMAGRFSESIRKHEGERVGVLLPDELPEPGGAIAVARLGRWTKPEEMAERLFAGLRALDAQGCSVILCPLPPGAGIGEAIRDRLRKAATREV